MAREKEEEKVYPQKHAWQGDDIGPKASSTGCGTVGEGAGATPVNLSKAAHLEKEGIGPSEKQMSMKLAGGRWCKEEKGTGTRGIGTGYSP